MTKSPFVVYGVSKSGTTWVQMVLDAHPDIRCFFQRDIFPAPADLRLSPQVMRKATSSPFQDVKGTEDTGVSHSTLSFARRVNILQPYGKSQVLRNLVPPDREVFDDLRRRSAAVITWTILDDVEQHAIVGTKAHTNLDLLFDVFPDAKVIHCLRDGRDVLVSRRYHMLRSGERCVGDERFSLMTRIDQVPLLQKLVKRALVRMGKRSDYLFKPADDPAAVVTPQMIDTLGASWSRMALYIHEWSLRKPENILLIRYEDMLADKATQFARMYDFLGADTSDHLVEEVMERTSFTKLKKSGSSSFFRSGKSGDWRDHFTQANKQQFKRVAGEALVTLGYENDMNW